MDMEKLLCDIEQVARRASRIMLDAHKPAQHKKEGHYNFVTDSDVAVQNMLISELGRLLPGALFFAEEKENQQLTDDYTFVIDPINGTLNFMRSRACSAIWIALMQNKEPVLGLIYDPYRDEMFTALKGKGAYLNGTRDSRVSTCRLSAQWYRWGTSPYLCRTGRQDDGYRAGLPQAGRRSPTHGFGGA